MLLCVVFLSYFNPRPLILESTGQIPVSDMFASIKSSSAKGTIPALKTPPILHRALPQGTVAGTAASNIF